MTNLYELVAAFKKRYPKTVTWHRLKKHCGVILKHLNPGEEVIYAFAAQKNDNPLDFFSTCVIALTNKRILIGQKRVLFGYSLSAITPDMYNDMSVYRGIIWGKITIDTIKEVVVLTNIDTKGLPEIETNISEFMMREKKKYASEN